MAKHFNKTRKRDSKNAALVKNVADIHGKSTSMVYKVLAGDRKNEEVFSTYMFLLQESNALVEEAKKMVPFD